MISFAESPLPPGEEKLCLGCVAKYCTAAAEKYRDTYHLGFGYFLKMSVDMETETVSVQSEGKPAEVYTFKELSEG